MNKQDIIYYVEKELEGLGMFLDLHNNKEYQATFIHNKYDRKRAHVKLNPNYYGCEKQFIASALHELGHARMYAIRSTKEYNALSTMQHELGAWNIALRNAESLGIKLDKKHIERCLGSYNVGKRHIEGMLEQWNHCLF